MEARRDIVPRQSRNPFDSAESAEGSKQWSMILMKVSDEADCMNVEERGGGRLAYIDIDSRRGILGFCRAHAPVVKEL